MLSLGRERVRRRGHRLLVHTSRPIAPAPGLSGLVRHNPRVSEVVKRPIGLGLVLAVLAGTLVLGAALKLPCAAGNWTNGRQYVRYCYSDIVPLLGTEQLTGGRLPYLDACADAPGECDEYPVVSMYAMRLAAWVSVDVEGYFWANVGLLTLCAVSVAICLFALAGARALYFAAAPTLLVYGFINWDLIAVAFATGALLAYARRANAWVGILLGLGAAAKIYPALLVVPLALHRFREREPDQAIHLAWGAAGSWLAVNVPFVLAAPAGWWEFFRLNTTRSADWDSLWFIGCHRLTGELYCEPTRAINIASAIAFVAIAVYLYALKRRADPDFERWTFVFPLVVAFLLTNKVYSPQYSLWLLPLFALAFPNLRMWALFEAADIAVFLTRFSWFARHSGFGGWPIGAFEIAVLVRAAILIACIVVWMRREREEPLLAEPVAEAAPA